MSAKCDFREYSTHITPPNLERELPKRAEDYCGIPIERVGANPDGYLQILDPGRNKHVLIGNITSNPQSPVVLSSAARLPGGEYTGHKAPPQDYLVGPEAQVLMVSANATFTDEEIEQLVTNARMIAVFGGSHPGPNMTGSSAPSYRMELDGGYDDERDRIEFHLLQKAIELDKPLLGVCRGLHAGVAMLLANIEGITRPEDMHELGPIFTPAEPHHRAEPEEPFLTHPLIQALPPDMRHLCPWIEGYTPVTYHNLKITYGYLQTKSKRGLTYEEELRRRGWYVAAVDRTEGVLNKDRAIEILIRLNGNGEVDSYLIQSHPEKPAPGTRQQPHWHVQQEWSQGVARIAMQ